MSIFSDLKTHIEKSKATLKDPAFKEKQERYSGSMNVLQGQAKQLKELGKTAFTNFSYGPEGKSQQKWETTRLADNGIFYQAKIDNDGKKHIDYEFISNNGEYASFSVNENMDIYNLVVMDNNGIFRETALGQLPIKDCQLTAEDIMMVMNSFQPKTATAETSNLSAEDGMGQ